MNPVRKKRLLLIGLMVGGVAITTALMLNAFQSNVMFFFSPTQVAAGEAPVGHNFRVGGLVETGSVTREEGSLTVQFTVTDGDKKLPIYYAGILPDLFREGQGIIAKGKLDDTGRFTASEVLAKHDENYMPPEVADALRKSGKWKEGQTSMPEGMY